MSVDIYIQHDVSEPGFYEGPLKEEESNPKDIINIEEEEDWLAKLYEEVVRNDCDMHGGEVHDGEGQYGDVHGGGIHDGKG